MAAVRGAYGRSLFGPAERHGTEVVRRYGPHRCREVLSGARRGTDLGRRRCSQQGRLGERERLGASRGVAGGRCGIRRSDSKIVCWGLLNSTFPTSPTPDAFTDLASDGGALCGIRASDRKVLCWGQNDWGESPPGPSSNAYRAVAVGSRASCGIRSLDDRVACWGAGPDNGGLAAPVSSHTYRDLKMSGFQVCGVALDDGHIYCWSSTNHGVEELADSGLFESVVPYSGYFCGILQGTKTARCSVSLGVPNGVALSSLTYETGGGCGVRATDSRLVCWNRQMVDVTPPGIEAPVTSLGGATEEGCVVTAGGRLRCWGDNLLGHVETLPPRGAAKQLALAEGTGVPSMPTTRFRAGARIASVKRRARRARCRRSRWVLGRRAGFESRTTACPVGAAGRRQLLRSRGPFPSLPSDRAHIAELGPTTIS